MKLSMIMMKSRRLGLLSAAVCWSAVTLLAQTGDESEDVFELSPFEVDGSKDNGYRAENTLAGSRLNSSLRDTPASIQVYTKEFLEDIGAIDLKDILAYSANVESSSDEESFFIGAREERGFTNFEARVRGLPASRARDYFKWNLPFDNYLTERLDESRGPNALLFGIAAAGGIQNQSTKKASYTRDSNRLTFRSDSYGLVRCEIDINRVLVKDKLGVRLNALYADGDGWRSNTFNKKKAIHFGLTYRPDEKTIIRLGHETFGQEDVVSNAFAETDLISQWLDAGSPTFDIFSANRIPQASANGTVSAVNRDTLLRSDGVTNLGTNPQVTIFEGGDPSLDGQAVSLYRSLQTSQYLDTNGNGQYTVTNNVARGESVFPYDVSLNGPANRRDLNYTDSTITLQREMIDDLFVQLDYNESSSDWDNMPGGKSVRGDANAYYAGADRTAATAFVNPNAGSLYVQDGALTNWRTEGSQKTLRMTATYDYDFAERGDGFAAKLGSHRIAAGYEHFEQAAVEKRLQEQWIDAATGMPAYNTALPGGTNVVWRRKYIDIDDPSTWVGHTFVNHGVSMPDPLNPSRMIYSDWGLTLETPPDIEQTVKAKMISAQSFFFDRRLVLTAGYREDDGESKKFLYELNDLHTSYERIGGDAFASTDYALTNRTAGAVFHLNESFSMFYNKASNSNVPFNVAVIIGSLDNPGQLTFPGAGEGEDLGVMANLFDNKINVRLTRYETREDNALNGSGAAGNIDGFHDQVIEWWDRLGFGLPNDPAAPRVFADRVNRFAYSNQSEGYELQLTANLNKNWRATMNYSYTDKNQSNVGVLENQWFENTIEWALRTVGTWDTSTITQAMIDGGIVATNDPNEFLLENGSTTLADRIQTAEIWRANNMVEGPPFGLRKNKFNFFTNYSFDEGRLKGFSVGGGYRYLGKNAMHWVTEGDGSRTRIMGQSTGYADAMLRYRTKMTVAGKDVKASFQVNIQNLFNDDDPTIARYLLNDVTNPADRLYLVAPRSFRFTSSFDF